MWASVCVCVGMRGQPAGPVFSFLWVGSGDWTQVGGKKLIIESPHRWPFFLNLPTCLLRLWLWAWHVANTQEVSVCWPGSFVFVIPETLSSGQLLCHPEGRVNWSVQVWGVSYPILAVPVNIIWFPCFPRKAKNLHFYRALPNILILATKWNYFTPQGWGLNSKTLYMPDKHMTI